MAILPLWKRWRSHCQGSHWSHPMTSPSSPCYCPTYRQLLGCHRPYSAWPVGMACAWELIASMACAWKLIALIQLECLTTLKPKALIIFLAIKLWVEPMSTIADTWCPLHPYSQTSIWNELWLSLHELHQVIIVIQIFMGHLNLICYLEYSLL